MATRKQRVVLISANDVGEVFSGDEIKRIAAACKLPGHSDLIEFRACVCDSVRSYLNWAAQSDIGETRDRIAGIERLARHALNQPSDIDNATVENLAAEIALLSQFDRTRLSAGRVKLPTKIEIRAAHGTERLKILRKILMCVSLGAKWVEGRNRPSGNRSQSWFPVLNAPETRGAGQPAHNAELWLVRCLRPCVRAVTGKWPAQSASWERPGPFVRLVGRVLELCGAESVDAAGLIEAERKTRLALLAERCKRRQTNPH